MICAVCPAGCALTVDGAGPASGPEPHVQGGCKKGVEFALKEMRDPERLFTATVRVAGGEFPLAPVRSDRPVKKDEVAPLARRMDACVFNAPLAFGRVLARGVGKNRVNIVVTRSVKKKEAP
jgi:CxxC motif-containing protein